MDIIRLDRTCPLCKKGHVLEGKNSCYQCSSCTKCGVKNGWKHPSLCFDCDICPICTKHICLEYKRYCFYCKEKWEIWNLRLPYLFLDEGCPKASGHIAKYLFNDMAIREICLFLTI